MILEPCILSKQLEFLRTFFFNEKSGRKTKLKLKYLSAKADSLIFQYKKREKSKIESIIKGKHLYWPYTLDIYKTSVGDFWCCFT